MSHGDEKWQRAEGEVADCGSADQGIWRFACGVQRGRDEYAIQRTIDGGVQHQYVHACRRVPVPLDRRVGRAECQNRHGGNGRSRRKPL